LVGKDSCRATARVGSGLQEMTWQLFVMALSLLFFLQACCVLCEKHKLAQNARDI
jgi:hypothetical protein